MGRVRAGPARKPVTGWPSKSIAGLGHGRRTTCWYSALLRVIRTGLVWRGKDGWKKHDLQLLSDRCDEATPATLPGRTASPDDLRARQSILSFVRKALSVSDQLIDVGALTEARFVTEFYGPRRSGRFLQAPNRWPGRDRLFTL